MLSERALLYSARGGCSTDDARGVRGPDGPRSLREMGSSKISTRLSVGNSAEVQEQQQQQHRGEVPLVLEGVKNIRDLASVKGFGIVEGRVYRTGALSGATKRDADRLRNDTGLRTLVRGFL